MRTKSRHGKFARLRWIKEVGFDDVLCMAKPESLDDLARLRDAL